MSMEARIIGLQGCGKSTLLAALGEGRTEGTIATVRLGDDRVRRLAEIFNPRKTVFAEFQVREAVWPEATARKGAMDRYLDQIAGAQVFLHVLRDFFNPFLGEPADPAKDLKELDEQFLLADLVAVERALERTRKAPLPAAHMRALERCRDSLEAETPLRLLEFDEAEESFLKSFAFLTRVLQVILVNSESGAEADMESVRAGAADRHSLAFPFAEALEVARLPAEEQQEFAEAMGLPGPPAEVVARAAFDAMGLITFFTVGEDEVRAWPIRIGTRAREAAGTVHSDIERGFIRAEVVSYADFMQFQSLKACREAGVLRIEGKDYVVEDGEIVHFRFNV
ncbi:MAG: redox-regulated ATPase YchF [Thermoleophilia bacterium]